MTKRIRDIGPKPTRIVDTSPKPERLDPAIVAAALCAELVGEREKGGSPMAVFAARQAMFKRLAPAAQLIVTNGTNRCEVPLAEHEWDQLQQLTSSLANGGQSPTVAQVAGALLRLALAASNIDSLRQGLAGPATADGSAAQLPTA